MSVAKRSELLSWFEEVDAILRGASPRVESLRAGQLQISAFRLFIINILLSGVYGLCMGGYGLFINPDKGEATFQMIASALKLPILFYLTVMITMSSLYVFNALTDTRLGLPSIWRLLNFTLCLLLAVLAAFGPIVLFFSAFSESYAFVVLLNVAVFAMSGVIAFGKLLQLLGRLLETRIAAEVASTSTSSAGRTVGESDAGSEVQDYEIESETDRPDAPEPTPGPDPSSVERGAEMRQELQRVQFIFRFWVVVFALVGAQMAWILRPFIGSPNIPFTVFRPRGSNFFEAVWQKLAEILGG